MLRVVKIFLLHLPVSVSFERLLGLETKAKYKVFNIPRGPDNN